MPFSVFHSLEELPANFGAGRRTVLTVGVFDGLHVGHQKILQLVRDRARSSDARAAVVTFDPHPMRVLAPEKAPLMIQTLAQRLAGFERIGLDTSLVLRFDQELAHVSAEEFIQRFLVHGLQAGVILIGANFRFGHRGAGDASLLAEFGKRAGFDVEIIPPVEIDGQIVSSTAVRNAIAAGNVGGAIPLLGRPFCLTGEIKPGAGRGRTILFPTLNLAPEQELLPKLGVYATETIVGGKIHPSVSNVGTRPTFNGAGVTVESHLFGFKDILTSGTMEVRFHARIRDEQKFSSPEALREQISRDIDAAQKYFSERIVAEETRGT